MQVCRHASYFSVLTYILPAALTVGNLGELLDWPARVLHVEVVNFGVRLVQPLHVRRVDDLKHTPSTRRHHCQHINARDIITHIKVQCTFTRNQLHVHVLVKAIHDLPHHTQFQDIATKLNVQVQQKRLSLEASNMVHRCRSINTCIRCL